MDDTPETKVVVKERIHSAIGKLFSEKELILRILQELNFKWKMGDEVWEHITTTMDRLEEFAVVFDYLIRSQSNRAEFIEEYDIEDPEHIAFLAEIEEKFIDLQTPLRDYGYQRAGVRNHLVRFSRESIFYDSERKMVLASFSVYTAGKKIMQVTDHVDDLVWLASMLIDYSNQAIRSCLDKQIDIKDYLTILAGRFDDVDKFIKEYKELLLELQGNITIRDEQTEPNNSLPDVEL